MITFSLFVFTSKLSSILFSTESPVSIILSLFFGCGALPWPFAAVLPVAVFLVVVFPVFFCSLAFNSLISFSSFSFSS